MNAQLTKIVLAGAAAVCLIIGLAWTATDPAWGDEAVLGLSLFLGLCSFHLP